MRLFKKVVLVLTLMLAAPHLIDMSLEPLSKSSLADTQKLYSED